MKTGFLIIIVCLALSSCFDDAIWNDGQELIQRIDLEDYHTIELNSIFDVVLVQDSLNYALITCGENIMDYVKISQNGDLLQLRQTTGMNLGRSYRHILVELHFQSLSCVRIKSSVRIDTKLPVISSGLTIEDKGELSELNLNVICDNFIMEVSEDNLGIYKIAGRAIKSNLLLNGSAHFRTENLAVDTCNFIHDGIGDCYVNATKFLAGEILRNGSLFYKDYPFLKVQIENKKGKIIIR